MLPTNTVVDHQLGQSQGLDQDIPIDPALFDIEQIVYDARKNKERLMGEEETRRAVDHLPVQMAEAEEEVMNDHGDDSGAGDGLGLLDEEFDPALREIVNSLTNAQQSTSIMGTSLTPAQAQAAIDAHLHEDHENMGLKSFADLERGGYGMMDDQYQGENDNFLLPEAGPSGTYHDDDKHHDQPPPVQPLRRGRPKGSKNKPRPDRPAPPPPPSPPQNKRKRGRPPKKRTPEEEAEIERRKAEKAAGIKRMKGRPRKYPGYLVREMRLKKNRSEYRELLNRYDEDQEHAHVHGHGHRNHGEGGEGMDMDTLDQREGEGDGGGFWSENMERSILAAVEGLEGEGNGDGHGDEGMGHEDVPSSRAFEGEGDMEMRRVFGLGDDENQG